MPFLPIAPSAFSPEFDAVTVTSVSVPASVVTTTGSTGLTIEASAAGITVTPGAFAVDDAPAEPEASALPSSPESAPHALKPTAASSPTEPRARRRRVRPRAASAPLGVAAGLAEDGEKDAPGREPSGLVPEELWEAVMGTSLG